LTSSDWLTSKATLKPASLPYALWLLVMGGSIYLSWVKETEPYDKNIDQNWIHFTTNYHFIPDSCVAEFVQNHIPISGDGEEAMDSFEMHVIVIKTVISGLGARFLMMLFYWPRQRTKK